MKDIEMLIENSRLMFVFLFFSGVFFGVIAQRIVDNKEVAPILKRLAVAVISTSLAITIGKYMFKLSTPLLYGISPLVGFFGEAIVETLNKERTGVSKGIIEWFVEYVLKIPIHRKKGSGENEK